MDSGCSGLEETTLTNKATEDFAPDQRETQKIYPTHLIFKLSILLEKPSVLMFITHNFM